MENQNHQPLLVGVFRSIAAADRAVFDLADAGFAQELITVVCPTCSDEDSVPYQRQEPAGAHAAQGATTGGTIGALLGGLTAAVGVAATGGVGLLVAGSLLGGAAAGGVAGGFVGAMATRGLEPELADYYDQALQRGRILVAVESGEGQPSLERAGELLAKAGAEPRELPKG